MQEVEIKINKSSGAESIKLNLPTCWNELSGKQLLYVSKFWFIWKEFIQENISLTKARALLFLELTNITSRREKKRLCFALSFINEQTDVNILDTTNFIFGELTLTKNLLPSIPVGFFTKYYGPAEKLVDINISEFSFAFACYSNYLKTHQETHLDKLVAVLYRPKNKNYKTTGELRVDFNNKMITRYEKKTARLPREYKHAVFLFFKGCLEFLASEKQFPQVFNSGNEKKYSGGSFIDAVVNMSGGKFGPFDTTKNQNLYIILKELRELIIANSKTQTK
jgi:hypothetical protein